MFTARACREALSLEARARPPVEVSKRMRELFEQARNVMGLPTDQEALEPVEWLARAALSFLVFTSRDECAFH